MNQNETTPVTGNSRPLSDVLGLPKGSFTAFLDQKEAVLKRIAEAQKKHIREVRDCKMAWAQ